MRRSLALSSLLALGCVSACAADGGPAALDSNDYAALANLDVVAVEVLADRALLHDSADLTRGEVMLDSTGGLEARWDGHVVRTVVAADGVGILCDDQEVTLGPDALSQEETAVRDVSACRAALTLATIVLGQRLPTAALALRPDGVAPDTATATPLELPGCTNAQIAEAQAYCRDTECPSRGQSSAGIHWCYVAPGDPPTGNYGFLCACRGGEEMLLD